MTAAVMTNDRLDLLAGLSSISAGFLWLWVAILTLARPDEVLCGQTTALAHCPLCYPAAAVTALATLAWTLRLRRTR